MLNLINVLRPSQSLPVDRTRGAARPTPTNRNHRHFCGEAVIDEIIEPFRKGRVRYRAGWWPALCEANVAIAPGETVEVVGIRGIALLVQPLPLPQRA